jgi:hypothetical protein
LWPKSVAYLREMVMRFWLEQMEAEPGGQAVLDEAVLDAMIRAEIESALERAEHLVASIEGSALSPRILELRGRLAAAVGDAPSSDRTLREALNLYRTIGATGHAERLARELDA